MPKPIFYGRLDFIELMTSVAMLNSDAEKSAWLMSFCTALAKNETGKNDLADSILLEAQKARIDESKRKEAYRYKFVPRTDTDGRGLTRERQTVPVSVPVSVNTNTKKKNNTVGKTFVSPTLEDCISFFTSHNSVEANATDFFNYYTANGWMVGKNKMKSWHGAGALWISRSYSNAQKQAPRETTQERINRENLARLEQMNRDDQLPFLGSPNGR